jgi:hypothetical protein
MSKGPEKEEKEKSPVTEPPKVLRSEIPARTINKRSVDQDVGFVTALMKSVELRKIVIINLLEDYEPTPGARKALEWTQHSGWPLRTKLSSRRSRGPL